jgi:hypothetical protein
MSRLATLLREYYERSSYKSIAALAEAAQAYSPLSLAFNALSSGVTIELRLLRSSIVACARS